jgi:protein-tyrosine-phosphatase
MAKAIADDRFRRLGLPYGADSRGINVLAPSRASENAVRALSLLYKIDLSPHISRQLSEGDMRGADLVLTMTRSQKDYLTMVYGPRAEKARTLAEFAGAGRDVADPYGGDIAVYQRCASTIADMIERGFRE